MMNRDALRYDALKLAVKAGFKDVEEAERVANVLLDVLTSTVERVDKARTVRDFNKLCIDNIKSDVKQRADKSIQDAINKQLATNARQGNETLSGTEGFKYRQRDDGKWEQVPKARVVGDAEFKARVDKVLDDNKDAIEKLNNSGFYCEAPAPYSDEDLKDIYGRD